LQTERPPLSEKGQQILTILATRGASFFASIQSALGGGFPGETRDALWELVWAGLITNDTFDPLRDLLRPRDAKRDRAAIAQGPPGSPEYLRTLRSRKSAGGPAQGRWSLVSAHQTTPLTATQWSANIAQQLLARHGIIMRETAIAENIPRGYNAVYPALKTMEESGWIRRGMFVAGMGAAQFAATSAVDMLRSLRSEPTPPETVALAASDPANLYGTLLPWPRTESEEGETASHSMSRTSGAGVILINGLLAAFLRRRNSAMRLFLPENEPEHTQFARELAKKLAELAVRRQGRRTGLLIGEINNAPAREHFLVPFLEEAGFVNTAMGFQMRRLTPMVPTRDAENSPDDADNDLSETA
jgi:ATP-dependent Lhr-like helicase